VVILFEGRDAAGKGGALKRFPQHLNPRGSEHVALPNPNEAEACNEMLLATDTLVAPWTIVNSNGKRRARLGAIRSLLHAPDDEHRDHDAVGEPDPRVVRSAPSVRIDN
jgi:polyphosphate kinase 2 (PPK2 family)